MLFRVHTVSDRRRMERSARIRNPVRNGVQVMTVRVSSVERLHNKRTLELGRGRRFLLTDTSY